MTDVARQLIANGLVAGSACGALALAFGILYRVGGFYQFTLASIYSVAAYASLPRSASRWQLVAGFGEGIAAAVVIALMFEIGIYSRLRRRRAPPLVPMLASLGVVAIVENLLAMLFGPGLHTSAFVGEHVLHVGGALITELRLAEAVTCGGFGALCVLLLYRTDIGAVLRAIASNPELAALKGVRVRLTINLSTGLAAVIAAIPACFAALDTGTRPTMGNLPLLLAIAAVLVGGARSAFGWLIAGFSLGILGQFAILVFSARWADTVVFALLCGALLARRTASSLVGYQQ